MTAVAREAAGDDFQLFFHAAFNTLEENIHALSSSPRRRASTACCCRTRPPSGRRPIEEVFDYTKQLADSTDLGVMLFGLPAWGFERIDNAGMPVPFVRDVLDAIPNIVAIKAEQGYPGDRRRHGDVPPLPRRGHHLLPH